MVRMFHFRAYFSLLTRIKATGEGEGGEVTQQMFIRGGSSPPPPEIQLLTLL